MAVSSTGPATGFDIVAYRGDTFERWLRITRNSVEEELSGPAYLLQIRSANALIKQLDGGSNQTEGISIDSPNNGVLKIAMTAETMRALPLGDYDYDLQQQQSQRVKTLIRGKFSIVDDISRYP